MGGLQPIDNTTAALIGLLVLPGGAGHGSSAPAASGGLASPNSRLPLAAGWDVLKRKSAVSAYNGDGWGLLALSIVLLLFFVSAVGRRSFTVSASSADVQPQLTATVLPSRPTQVPTPRE